MKPKQIASALLAAKMAAEKFRLTPDGGTCNMDSAVFFPGRIREKTINDAAERVGVRVSFSHFLGHKACFIRYTEGQAARRTAMAEAACRALEDAGLDAMMYYQMD